MLPKKLKIGSLAFILTALAYPLQSNAVIKRHDVASAKYEVPQAPSYLIDMPHEGHGVLIKPNWIVTVAHTIFYDYTGKELTIGDKQYEIESVFIHPDYKELDKSILQGDAAPLMAFLQNRSDIALIKLKSDVADKHKPIELYRGNSEKGMTFSVFGKGATGDGVKGEASQSNTTRKLHRFQNIVTQAKSNWLVYRFDAPEESALELEGFHGSRDSGSGSVINVNGKDYLIGLSSWQYYQGDLANFKGGLYGTEGYQIRISAYIDWITNTVGSEAQVANEE